MSMSVETKQEVMTFDSTKWLQIATIETIEHNEGGVTVITVVGSDAVLKTEDDLWPMAPGDKLAIGPSDKLAITKLGEELLMRDPSETITTITLGGQPAPCLAPVEEASTCLDCGKTYFHVGPYDDPYVLAQRFGMRPEQARSVSQRCESCMTKLGEAFRQVQACFPEGLEPIKSGNIH